MSFYALVDAGHRHKTLEQCEIEHAGHGIFGDYMHCHGLADTPVTVTTANKLKMINNSVWLIGEKIKKDGVHGNKLSIFEYFDGQWIERSYISPSFKEGYQITQLEHQYSYPIIQ